MEEPEHTNRKLPRVSSAAEPALEEMINKLAEELEQSPAHRDFVAGQGIRIINDPNNTIIELMAPASRKAKYYPFKLYQQDAANKPLEVSVFYGTIDGNVPVIKDSRSGSSFGTPINGSQQDSAKAASAGDPEEILDPDSPEFVPDTSPVVTAGDGDGEYQIWIKYTPLDPCASDPNAVVGDSQHPNEVQISAQPLVVDPNLRSPPNPDRVEPLEADLVANGTMPLSYNGAGYVEIGRVTVKNEVITKINNSLTHSLMHTSCGVRHYFWGV